MTNVQRCKECEGYFSAEQHVLTNDPSLARARMRKFWGKSEAHRAFIIGTHGVPHNNKVLCIATLLRIEEMRPTEHSRETEQEMEEMVAIAAKQFSNLTQEHFHCHSNARYKPSMPHSNSARYRASSHVPPVRSNPLRFFKSAT